MLEKGKTDIKLYHPKPIEDEKIFKSDLHIIKEDVASQNVFIQDFSIDNERNIIGLINTDKMIIFYSLWNLKKVEQILKLQQKQNMAGI